MQPSHRLLDTVPDEQPDLCCPWNSWCCVMYSAVDSFPHRMNFNYFFSPFCRDTDSFARCLCTAGYYSSYYLSELQSLHVPRRNKAERHSQRWKEQREYQFSALGLRGVFFFLLQRVKIMLMSHLRSRELRFDGKMGCVPMAEGWAKTKMSWIHLLTAVSKFMSTYFNLPTIPWQHHICWSQLPLRFLMVSNQPSISHRMPRVSIRIH